MNCLKLTTSVVLLLLLIFTASSKADSGTFSEIYQAKKVVELKTEVGSLELKSWDRDEILVECDYDMSGDLYIDPVIRERKNSLVIKGEIEGRRSNHYSSSVLWTITVPKGTEVEFNSTSGGVDIKDFDGTFSGSTASGSIELRDCKGNYHFNTASGSIDIDNCDGEFKLNTASGRVRARESKGIFKLTSASGEVDINNVTLAGESEFTTASGDAFVSLAQATEFDLEIASASGDATLDFNGNEISGFIQMSANDRRGNIRCPFDFDDVSYKKYKGSHNDQVIKSVTVGKDNPYIAISTGSGRASLTK